MICTLLFDVLQIMLFLEFVPLVVVHRAIPIQIQLFMNILCGLGEMGLELLPAHLVVPIRVQVPKMGVEYACIRHGCLMMARIAGTTGN